MELPDDCITIIKSYAGITSLEIVECYRRLKHCGIEQIEYRCDKYCQFRVSAVFYLLQLLPYLVKKSKKVNIGYEMKSRINQHVRDYVNRNEIMVAMDLLKYPKMNDGFQAEFINDCQLTRSLKKQFKFKYPHYKLEYRPQEYEPLITYAILSKLQPRFNSLSKHKDEIENEYNKTIRILNYKLLYH